METERIAVSSLAYTIFRVNIFRPAGISAKACVRCIQDQPGSCCLLWKFFLVCGFSIFCHRIWKCTEMEIITAHNLNGMCSIRKNGKPRILMATAFARYYKRNVLFCYRRCIKSNQCCAFSVCIRLPVPFPYQVSVSNSAGRRNDCPTLAMVSRPLLFVTSFFSSIPSLPMRYRV